MENGVEQATRLPITVVLLMPDDLLREGLAGLLSDRGGFVVAGMWSEAADALAGVSRVDSCVVLLDISLPGLPLADLLDRIRESNPATRVIAIANCQPDRCVMGTPPVLCDAGHGTHYIACDPRSEIENCLQLALNHGACGAIHHPSNSDQIAAAIRCVASGQHWIDLPTALRRAARSRGPGGGSGAGRIEMPTLSSRERQIVRLIASGCSNKIVARELQLAYSTVKNHVSGILDKLHLESRTQLVRYSLDHPDEV